MHIVLFQPEIPENTGNISRTCAITNAKLHLIEPLGFRTDDKSLKRAGLDYWQHLDVKQYRNWEKFLEANPDANIYLCSTKATKHYSDVQFKENDYLVFGRETGGLADYVVEGREESLIRIPMGKNLRSLNLSNSVAIILYEALRQLDFPNLD